MTIYVFCDGCFEESDITNLTTEIELYGTRLHFCSDQCLENFRIEFENIFDEVDPYRRHRRCNCRGPFCIYYKTSDDGMMELTPGSAHYNCEYFAKALARYYFLNRLIPDYYIHFHIVDLTDDEIDEEIRDRRERRLLRLYRRNSEIINSLRDELAVTNEYNQSLRENIEALTRILNR